MPCESFGTHSGGGGKLNMIKMINAGPYTEQELHSRPGIAISLEGLAAGLGQNWVNAAAWR